MIGREPRRQRYLNAALAMIVLALLGGIGIFAELDATNLPLDAPDGGEASLPDLPGVVDTYPTVVAYVDGHAISGKSLAIGIAAIEQSPLSTIDKSQEVRDALHAIIQDQILIDHATDYGVSVSYGEARAEAQKQKALALSSPQGLTAYAPLAQQLGVSTDDYFDLPSVIQGYRLGMILGEMRQYILERAPVSRRGSEAGREAAVDAFVNDIHAEVQILIDVP